MILSFSEKKQNKLVSILVGRESYFYTADTGFDKTQHIPKLMVMFAVAGTVVRQCLIFTWAVRKVLENLFSKYMSLYRFLVMGDFR